VSRQDGAVLRTGAEEPDGLRDRIGLFAHVWIAGVGYVIFRPGRRGIGRAVRSPLIRPVFAYAA